MHELVERRQQPMMRVLAVGGACCALAFFAGCGSSGSGKSATSNTRSSSSSGGSNTVTLPSGRSTSHATSPGASLKVDTTPKFASPSKSEAVHSGVVQIAYRNIAIDPDTVRVKVGSTIRWTNYDSTKANVTSVNGPQRFASKNFGEGGTFEIKAEKPGVIHYECTLYPVTMNGTIEVVG
jgi:plastocyanin